MRQGFYTPRVGACAPIAMAAALEYLCAELVELAGITCQAKGKRIIQPRHIMLAIAADDALV